jgi:tight adherence protein B
LLAEIDPIWIFYACAAGAVIATVDAIINLAYASTSFRSQVNRRLSKLEKAADRNQAIVELRRDRGLSEVAVMFRPLVWLNRLIVQSGISRPLWQIAVASCGAGMIAFLSGLMLWGPLAGILCGMVVTFAGPLAVLGYIRRRRRARFTEQFAEAIDIIVRSLRAGHPVPVAIKMAAREMADPIGSEFGMVEDEVAYGLDLETAVRNMADRVGQEDLPLFVASVAIQMSSGGNLTEILEGLSEVVRLRAKMRRKIRALSAEGRMSALILSSTPIILFVIINWLTPDFYGKNWDHPWIVWGLAAAGFWMMVGNLMMHKMINFRF